MTEQSHDHLRLGDADRLHALNVLGEHFAEGRLDASEFDTLSGEAASARTLGAMREIFAGLPGGLPLEATGEGIVHRPVGGPGSGSGTGAGTGSSAEVVPASGGAMQQRDAESEIANLYKRGKMVENLDGIVLGVTLVSFLVLQFVVGWNYAWIVWPSLALTLTIPRALLKYDDDDEELYEEIKESESEARKKRLRQAADRIRELEEGTGDDR